MRSRGRRRSPLRPTTTPPRSSSGEPCPTGSSSIAGLAFYDGGALPDVYDGALFFADYSRDCIWVMFQGANGLPTRATGRRSRPRRRPGRPQGRPRRRALLRRLQRRHDPQDRLTLATSRRARRDRFADQRAGAADSELQRQRLERPGGWAAYLRLGSDGDGAFDDSTVVHRRSPTRSRDVTTRGSE